MPVSVPGLAKCAAVEHTVVVRILVIKLGSIGDIVHTLPAVAAIRKRLPSTEISWVVEQRSAEILRSSTLIDDLVEVDTRGLRGATELDDALRDISRQIRHLRKKKFDLSIDFQGLLKSALIGQLSGARRRWGFDKAGLREPASRFLLTDAVETGPRHHIIQKNLALASAAVGIDLRSGELNFPIATGPEHRAEAAAIAATVGENFAILNPAGGWVTKLWHAEKFGQLADRLWEERGLMSVIATGPNESELAERAVAASRTQKLVAETPTLKGVFELCKRAVVYVGGDTGPTHLAIAAGARVVGLFGPTEWWRNGSPRSRDICVERNDIACRVDCHRRQCNVWICMDFGVDDVMAAIDERLGPHTEAETPAVYV